MPLSDDGYRQLDADWQRWLHWREGREHANESFAVEDSRSQSELDLEAVIRT